MADSRINREEGLTYWGSVNADDNGMLGGYAHISRVDLQGSRAFLVKLGVIGRKGEEKGDDGEDTKLERIVDCGAGIGRITRGLLLDIAKTVDIVEPITKFTKDLEGLDGIGDIMNSALQDWAVPDHPYYDLIWTQWCIGVLTDPQLVTYLEKCKPALKEGGYLIIKDNLSTAGFDVFDELDNIVTRTDLKFRELFEEAGMKIVRTERQNGFPSQLYPVRTYALQPIV